MILIIKANFNSFITDKLLSSCEKELKKQKVEFETVEMPGALEIAFMASKYMKSKKYKAIIALGCVIKGDTYHFEVVCNESARAVTELNLKGKIPVINGILTCYDVEQAQKRVKLGADYAKVAIFMANYN